MILRTIVAAGALVLAVPAASASERRCSVKPSHQGTEQAGAAVLSDPATAAAKLAAIIPCLGDPDPAVRDGFALTVLTAVLRSDALPTSALRPVRDQLLAMLAAPEDAFGVRRPFAAMGLAEVARADRIRPQFSAEERSALASHAAAYLRGVKDYRGFIPGEGWRHGVAHGADWLMQLALHPELHGDDAALMLDAIAAQVAPPGTHSYVHGESGRLARPVLFLAASGKLSAAQLGSFFAKLKPDAQPRWSNAYGTLEGLAAVHNTRSFANLLLVEALRSKNPQIQRLEAPLLDLLGALP